MATNTHLIQKEDYIKEWKQQVLIYIYTYYVIIICYLHRSMQNPQKLSYINKNSLKEECMIMIQCLITLDELVVERL